MRRTGISVALRNNKIEKKTTGTKPVVFAYFSVIRITRKDQNTRGDQHDSHGNQRVQTKLPFHLSPPRLPSKCLCCLPLRTASGYKKNQGTNGNTQNKCQHRKRIEKDQSNPCHIGRKKAQAITVHGNGQSQEDPCQRHSGNRKDQHQAIQNDLVDFFVCRKEEIPQGTNHCRKEYRQCDYVMKREKELSVDTQHGIFVDPKERFSPC